MRFKHVVAYRIEGISAKTIEDDIQIYGDDSNGLEVILTSTPNPHLYIIDRGLSLATLMLKGIFGPKGSGEVREQLEEEICEIQESRFKEIRSYGILIIKTSGDIDANLDGPLHETEDFIVCFDAIDKDTVVSQDQDKISVILTSLILALGRNEKVKKIREGVYLINDDGKVVHSLSVSASAAGIILSSPVSDELHTDVNELISLLIDRNDLERVSGLFIQSLDRSSSGLKSFISAWSALEIFISKIFREHSTRFFDDLYKSSPSVTLKNFLDRIADVMRDKYSLLDKFNIVGHSLGVDTVEDDIALFKSMKKTRDLLFHGQEIEEDELPVKETQTLFLRYFEAELRKV